MNIEQQVLAYMEIQANNQLADQMLSQPVMVPENLYVEQIGGGGISGVYFIVSKVADADLKIGIGAINRIGHDQIVTGEETGTVSGGTVGAPNHLIGRLKYSDNTVTFVQRTTGVDLAINDYFEFEVCRYYVSGGVVTIVPTNYYITPIVFGGVLS